MEEGVFTPQKWTGRNNYRIFASVSCVKDNETVDCEKPKTEENINITRIEMDVKDLKECIGLSSV